MVKLSAVLRVSETNLLEWDSLALISQLPWELGAPAAFLLSSAIAVSQRWLYASLCLRRSGGGGV